MTASRTDIDEARKAFMSGADSPEKVTAFAEHYSKISTRQIPGRDHMTIWFRIGDSDELSALIISFVAQHRTKSPVHRP